MRELFFLNQYLVRYKYWMLLGLLCVLLTNVFSASVPYLVRVGLDEALTQSGWVSGFADNYLTSNIYRTAAFFGTLILVVSLLRGVFMYYMRQTLIVVSRKVEYDLKNLLFNKYEQLGEDFYRKHMTGDLLNRMSEDVGNVRMYIGPAIMYFANMLFTFVVVIYQMTQVNAQLTLWVLLPLPFLSLSIYYVSAKMNTGNRIIQEQLSLLTASAQETFAGIRIIKSFGVEQQFIDKFNAEGQEYKRRSMALAKVNSLFFPLMLLLMGLSTLLVMYLGGKAVEQGMFTPGNLAEFVIYLNMLIWPVASLGWTTALVQKAAASQKRINEFVLMPEHAVGGNVKFVFQESIEFRNVSFRYPGKTENALSKINLSIKKGSILGITGRTGSGKSTLAQLLAAQYFPEAGELCFDNIETKQLDIASLRRRVAYVPQDVFLFSDSIRENILFGLENPDVSDERLNKVIALACLEKDIDQWPKGLDTIIGERGVSLSGGQKQRVSIARALLKDFELLIIDDGLSAVDAETERLIINNLSVELSDKTAIIISHRLAPLQLANRIVVLSDSSISEVNTHDNLLMSNDYYRYLYESQILETSA
jgi:ATP-binding cassette subfamily B multidrug efflux pump